MGFHPKYFAYTPNKMYNKNAFEPVFATRYVKKYLNVQICKISIKQFSTRVYQVVYCKFTSLVWTL